VDPDDVDALSGKGWALNDLGRYEEAISYSDKVLAIDPDDVDALNSKGVGLNSQGKSDEAIKYFDKILAIDANNIGALKAKKLIAGEHYVSCQPPFIFCLFD
jgi:tetratricopeptide (TPR) repeat protein